MSKERKLTPIAAALGATFAVSLIASPVTQAAANPFTMTDHGAGYMVAEGDHGDKMKGEGKCGDKKKEGEGKCGDKKMEGEGKCGDKKMEGEGKCGDKKMEGEGKCGDKKMEKMKEEGKCGEGKCGDKK